MIKKSILTKPNLSKRFYAGLVDYGVIALVTSLLFHFYGEPNNEGGYSLRGLPMACLVVFWFLWTVGAEQFFEATLGNHLQNLRVISIRGGSSTPSLGQSIKRHLLDMFDLWPFGIFGVLFIKNTKYNQRLGDLWAKTIVIDTTDSEQGIMHLPQQDNT